MTQTAKQKADELVWKFMDKVDVYPMEVRKQSAIQCAIICVEEMIKVSLPACEYGENTDYPVSTEFLQSVLTELKARL